VLISGIFLISIVPARSWIYQSVASFYSDRWVHFLAYASIAAIPVGTWKKRHGILLSFLPAIFCLVVEYVQGQAPGRIVTTHNVTADLFGIAAGILLGLNIRVMRSSTKTTDHANSDTHPSILC
jgi:hypothetical protein